MRLLDFGFILSYENFIEVGPILKMVIPFNMIVNPFEELKGARDVVRVGVLAYRSKHGDDDAVVLLEKMGKPPR